jgi:hypothetical protein
MPLFNWLFLHYAIEGITVHYNTVGHKTNNGEFLEFLVGQVIQDQVLPYTMIQINICIIFAK